MTDGSGGVSERQSYEPFGASSGSSLTRYGYTGREMDEATGLMYYRARWYDPQQARFISEDPIGGMNRYAYAGNNPISRIDPMDTSWSTFADGLKDGGIDGFWEGLKYGLLFSAISAAIAATAGAAAAPIMTALTCQSRVLAARNSNFHDPRCRHLDRSRVARREPVGFQ